MKKAIIVGASSGIGKSLAKILVENNYHVGITGRRTELLEALRSEHPSSYFVKSFDVTETNITARKLDELVAALGGLDLLIITAGTGELNKNLDFEIEQQTIQTNVLGFSAVAVWAFNYFLKQKKGHLVNISSVAGIRGGRAATAYNASKAFQINYLEGLRQKARRLRQNIYITDIRPGFVDTEMAKGNGRFWISTVDKATNQIFDAIKSKKKVAYITKRWRLIGILLKGLPGTVYEKM